MSLYIRLASRSGELEKVRTLLEYVRNDSKTSEELCHTCNMSLCNPEVDMMFLKVLHRQLEGRQALHWVVSHDTDVPIDTADMIAQKVLHLLAGKYQVFAATHTNTNNVHTHFVINPIDIRTGRKFSESIKQMKHFREQINEILEFYGLNRIGMEDDLIMSIDKWEAVSDEVHELKNEDSDEVHERNNPIDITYYEYIDDEIWSGKGMCYGQNLLLPGILQLRSMPIENEEHIEETPALIRGVTYDIDLVKCTVKKKFGDKVSIGTGGVENGLFIEPGIYYDQDE